MPRKKTTQPISNKEKGQRSIDLPLYLQRIIPFWGNPTWYDANIWRGIVIKQPIAMACREHLISRLTSLDWKIEPRDSSQRDELQNEMRYYTDFFTYTGEYDYIDILEWICQDLLDIPFGGACEIGRAGDEPNGKVLWIKLLDGGTLFPTLNRNYPVGQYVPEANQSVVYFPRHAINRIYLSPRTEIKREGWGMAPPEKIYLAISLLDRGDEYYAKLLLDTPEAGILDLGDMEKTSAENWVQAWRTMLGGIDPYKIAVLYEHTTQAKFVPFSRSPTELMFDKATFKYASIVAAGYGMTLSDIGLVGAMGGGGDTLAGTIRNERITRKSGFARLKAKIKYFFDRILPPTLEWKFIDLDDELSIAMGRARLATVTALTQAKRENIITSKESRLQMIADGLITISIPEKIPNQEDNQQISGISPERPSLLGSPVSPSQGGYGEIRSTFDDDVHRIFNLEEHNIKRLSNIAFSKLLSDTKLIMAKSENNDDILLLWNDWHDIALMGEPNENIPPSLYESVNQLRFEIISDIQKLSLCKYNNSDGRITNNLIEYFSSIAKKRLENIQKSEYELGKSDSIYIINLEDKYVADATKWINKLIVESENEISEYIANSVITGTRKAIIDFVISTHITEDIVLETIDKNVIKYIRDELSLANKNFVNEFSRKFSNIINRVMESE